MRTTDRTRARPHALLGFAVLLALGFQPSQESQTAAPSPPPSSSAARGSIGTEIFYLSGSGRGETRTWKFEIDSGRRAGLPSTIEVPAQWEQQGFGRYAYGRVDKKPAEVGVYETSFELPADWSERSLRLVFGGVMTDAEVLLNGREVGSHRGGFTEFGFDISEIARAGTNELRVRVAEASADRTVNRAERDADYWTFGGIYRPVWIEARPHRSITHVAVDARHDGGLELLIETKQASGCELQASVLGSDGEQAATLSGSIADQPTIKLVGQARDIAPWSAEQPELYTLGVDLICGNDTTHRVETRIGFRTIEVRPGRGLFINDRRTVLRGISRHSFWPETGRTLTQARNRADAELLKSLHFNAVRASHYPPDRAFLDACDEIGLYVLDELPGWKEAYSTAAGTPLVAELVRRDVNHPSVIAWDNGNEDGWNTELDPLFHRHDPQQRPVIHPRGRYGGFVTDHYSNWKELQKLIQEDTTDLLMPTEFLHGLYDGGGGASLFDYWTAMQRTPRFAGGFLWALLDEAVLRSDTHELDAWTNHGPDGIVGPYRELEPSAHTVRQLFAPVKFDALESGRDPIELTVHNGFDHTDLGDIQLEWRWIEIGERELEVGSGSRLAPVAPPGGRARVRIQRPSGAASLLRMVARDRYGREVGRMSWPIAREASAEQALTDVDPPLRSQEEAANQEEPDIREEAETVTLHLGDRAAVFSRTSGALVRLVTGSQMLETDIGTTLLGPPAKPGQPAGPGRRARLLGYEVGKEKGRARIRFGFEGDVRTATWTLDRSGQLHGNLLLVTRESRELVGIQLLPAATRIATLRWFGAGPTPVWRNRVHGPNWGLWSRQPADDPTARGFFGPFEWARLATEAGTLRVGSRARSTFLGVLAPELPDDSMRARAAIASGVTLLSHISAIGTKFHAAEDLGPSGADLSPAGLHRLELVLVLEAAAP